MSVYAWFHLVLFDFVSCCGLSDNVPPSQAVYLTFRVLSGLIHVAVLAHVVC